jgi:hypothetical protein
MSKGMRRLVRPWPLMLILTLGPAAIWLLWAKIEYHGLGSCPWNSHQGHPAVVGLVLVAASTAIAISSRRTRNRYIAVASSAAIGVVAGLAIIVVAFLFGAGLRCTD